MERDSQMSRKKDERRLFIFLIVFLFPMLAVAVVGGYGFAVWISQMFLGPPGPPG
ncbi:periplasmic nitrate reductase, NapE protein [Marinobacter salicampi]|uniref:periplasmic nitrate reductase, NapE protein n=1 Tax=Marinobacter salicampi TaxID=435907 RepID=UPI0014081A27|nr:periplasmic nitrate reductase, NapE protein [Marinobacter salicampi]